MELSISARQRRTARTAAAAPQAEKKSPAGAASKRPKTDKQDWSQTALAFLQEVNRQDMENRRRQLEAKQKNSGELEMLSKSLKVMEKCRKIASRIMKGDKVPPQDEQFLMEADPDGYKLAIACRVPKEKPKEWESVLEEDEESAGSSGGEAAEPVESGGEVSEA